MTTRGNNKNLPLMAKTPFKAPCIAIINVKLIGTATPYPILEITLMTSNFEVCTTVYRIDGLIMMNSDLHLKINVFHRAGTNEDLYIPRMYSGYCTLYIELQGVETKLNYKHSMALAWIPVILNPTSCGLSKEFIDCHRYS